MSRDTVEVVVLTNNNNHPLVAKVLACIGAQIQIQITSNYFGNDDDDVDREYKFLDEVTAIGIVGDDAIGVVTGAYMKDDNLILVADYGDEGECEFNINTAEHLYILKLNELDDVTPPPLPELSQEQFALIYETIQSERENTGNFIADCVTEKDSDMHDHYKELQNVEYILNQLANKIVD